MALLLGEHLPHPPPLICQKSLLHIGIFIGIYRFKFKAF